MLASILNSIIGDPIGSSSQVAHCSSNPPLGCVWPCGRLCHIQSADEGTIRGPSVSLHQLCDDILNAKMPVDTDPMSLSLLGVCGRGV